MDCQIKTFTYPNGEIQRVQIVRPGGWERLDFLKIRHDPASLDRFAEIYRNYLVPAQPWVFGNMVMFQVPADIPVDFPTVTPKYGALADRLTTVAAAMENGVRITRGKPVFRDPKVKELWYELTQRGCLQVISGRLPVTTIIPVSGTTGYLTQTEPQAQMKANASFFIMDRFDCATIYDHVGTPLGLCVKDGVVLNPPLFGREALLVKKDGSTLIAAPDVRRMRLVINGNTYVHGENATIYTRPDRSRTPIGKGVKLIIVGCRVAAVHNGKSAPIPASGFVLCPETPCDAKPGDPVSYCGMEDIQFGIQVGNSIIRDSIRTEKFISRFYNIRALEPVPFPPSLYPLDFQRSRAARMALGADGEGKPVLIWVEGAGKLGYTPGQDSCGASLSEMAYICSELGMINAVNLDGGGSAQILINNSRQLRISDRNKQDNSEAERPIPLGIVVR